METRMLPVRNARHDFRIDIGHNRVPLFRLEWRLVRQQVPQIAGLNARRDTTIAQRFHVARNVFDHFAAALSEFLDVHDGFCTDMSRECNMPTGENNLFAKMTTQSVEVSRFILDDDGKRERMCGYD